MDTEETTKEKISNRVYYLKNNARPRTITIYKQRFTDYLDEDGNKWNLKIICQREHNDDEELKELKKFMVADDEKVIIFTKNGRIQERKTYPVDSTFEVKNYPHVIEVHCGLSKFDERIYSIYVGGITEILRADDVDTIMKLYHFIDEVDGKGAVINKNPHLSKDWNKKMVVDMDRLPVHYENIASESLPTATPRNQRITNIEKDKDNIVIEKENKE